MRLIQRVLTAMIMLAALVACTGDGDPVLTSVEGAGWTSQLGATGGIIEITFDKNDAAATGTMPAQKVNANNTVDLIGCAFTSLGKTFAFWATSPQGERAYDDKGAIVVGTNSVALYARWNTVVGFIANGGTTPTPATNRTVLVGDPYGLLATTTRAGYDFAGWWPDASGGGSVQITSNTVVTNGNHALWARWVANTYTVSFDAQGGTPQPLSLSVVYDTVYSSNPLVSPTRPFMDFMGWWTGLDAAAHEIKATNLVQIASNHTLYARWGYAVTFIENGGSEVPDQIIVTGGKVLQPADPTKTGFVFGGWYKESTFVTQWNFGTDIVTMKKMLYAKWLTYQEYLTYVQKREFVEVPGGQFSMTSTTGSSYTNTVSNFKVGKYEVTYELWYYVRQTALAAGYFFANPGKEGNSQSVSSGAAPTVNRYQPVTTISWRDAIVWCNAYSEQSGLSPVYCSDSGCTMPIKDSRDGAYVSTINTTAGSVDTPYVNWNAKGYRLPTEGEWQYVASYKDGSSWTPYDWASGATGPYTDPTATSMVAWYATTGTQAVGTKAANGLGIYDMSGNVWEWCWDWEGGWPVVSTTDYAGPASGGNRILRGGSYGESIADHSRIGFRYQRYPYLEFYSYGFRLARNW